MSSGFGPYVGAVRSMLRRPPADAPLPDVEETTSGLAVDPVHVAGYAHVCGYTVSNALPPTYPHVLAFPMAMATMTGPDFPLSVVGLVHIAEEIVVERAPTVDDVLDLAVRPENLRPHRRGRQFDLLTTATVDGTRVWRSRSTYLRREESSRPPEAASPSPAGSSAEDVSPAVTAAGVTDELELRPSAQWRLPGDLGRRYAAVSGDRNPIHLHPLTARLFGFRRPIAHGMWTLARTLATVQNRLGDAYRVEAVFARPVFLPGQVRLATATATDADGGTRHGLELTDPRGRTHLTVAVTT